MESTLTSKGQATIPREVRDALQIGPGDKVKFFVHPDGRVYLLPMRPLQSLKGILRSDRHVTIEEMDMFTDTPLRRKRDPRAP